MEAQEWGSHADGGRAGHRSLPTPPPGYTLLGPLGSGGMANVYRAVQENLQRHVAIKYLSESHGNDPTAIERFRREAIATSELNHRNIVTVHECGEWDGRAYIVMECIDGFDLQCVLGGGRRLPEELVLLILAEVVEGLAATHARGIIHRDVKPANVLVSTSGDVKVTDFGLARSLRRRNERDQNLTGDDVVGTPYYMSPEQVRAVSVDPRTDVYSVGVMGYELLTGDLPFRGGTIEETLDAIAAAGVPSASISPEFVSAGRMIGRAMAKDPGERMPSMRVFGIEIGLCLEEVDPKRILARCRRTILRRFGADREGFLSEVKGLGFAERLAKYEQVETAALRSLAPGTSLHSKKTIRARRVADPARHGARKIFRRVPAFLLAVATTVGVTALLWPPGPTKPGTGGIIALQDEPVPSVIRASSGLLDPAAELVRPPAAPATVSDRSSDLRESAASESSLSSPVGLPRDEAQLDEHAAPATDPVPSTSVRTPVLRGAPAKPVPPAAFTRIAVDLEKRSPPSDPSLLDSSTFAKIRCEPSGDFYLNDRLVLARAPVALVELPASRLNTITVRHPELHGSRNWSLNGAPGDTLDLGFYRLETGVLRVACEPPGSGVVYLAGREAGEVPFRLAVATGEHLVRVARPGWVTQKVTVADRTAGTPARDIIPSDPAAFSGVTVDIRPDHDQKVTFYLGPALNRSGL